MLEALRGDLGGVKPEDAKPSRNAWPPWAAPAATGPPKRRDEAERRRAPNVTHTVLWRTRAPKVMENVTDFEH